MIGQHISCFAGVGMADIAAEQAGFKTVVTAEIDPFCRRILEMRFPEAYHRDDVRKVRRHGNTISQGGPMPSFDRPLLVTGGFPCQDLSAIGAGRGLIGDRSGLVHEQLRIVREFQPEYALFENSALLTSRGLNVIIIELDRIGYNVRWECIPAAIVDAPHMRDRCWIMARKTLFPGGQKIIGDARFHPSELPSHLGRSGVMNAGIVLSTKPLVTRRAARLNGEAVHGTLLPTPRAAPNEWRTTRNAPTHGNGHGKTMAGELNDRWRAAHSGQTPPASSESCGNVDPAYIEWVMGLPIGWTNPDVPNYSLQKPLSWRDPKTAHLQTLVANAPHRRGRLKALGNGLVPQVANIALDLLVNK